MPVLCRPAIAIPEHVVTLSETLAVARHLHAGHPRLPTLVRLVENTGIRRRHLIRPMAETLRCTDFGHRTRIFEREAKARLPTVISGALGNAGLDAAAIDAIILVSCTGFMMPSLTAWMINELGFRASTVQLPIAQLGCTAGAAAINRGYDFCRARPGEHALVVAAEFCSLCYQPDDLDMGSLLSNALFGDAAAAAVIRGDESGTGLRLHARTSHLIRGTETWIAYEVNDTGFHFRLDKRLPGAIQDLLPDIAAFLRQQGHELSTLDSYVIHPGGRRVLDALGGHRGIPAAGLRHSWQSLADNGNLASVSVLDVLDRVATDRPSSGDTALIAGFGPGVTAELSFGTWTYPNGGQSRS
jgi:1,3,6,8-tetrahydroxynaphthalene synthase